MGLTRPACPTCPCYHPPDSEKRFDMKALARYQAIAVAVGVLLAAGSDLAGQSPASPPPTGAPAAERLAERIQARIDGIRNFSAEFTQTYRGGGLREPTSERGSVLIKKPGRMRWTYTGPEDKLFVADGQKMYMYVPADRQVMVRNMPAADLATTPVLFLAGRGNVARDFRAEYFV